MKAFLFIRNIFKKYPALLSNNVLLLFIGGLFDAVSVFALIPIIDFLVKPGLKDISPVTQKMIEAMKVAGFSVTLSRLLIAFLLFSVLKISFLIFAQRLMFKTKYRVMRDIMIGSFEDFFQARWYFFSSSKQGAILNTFIREINVVGDSFGAMARFFARFLEGAFCLAVPFYLSWRVTSICMGSALLFALPFVFLGRMNYRLGKKNTSTANHMGSVIQENLSMAKVILGFGNQSKGVKALDDAFSGHSKATIKSQTLGVAIPLMYYPFGVLVLIIGMLISQRFGLSMSEAAVLLYSFLRIVPCVTDLIAQKNSLDNFLPSYEQIVSLRNRASQLKQVTGAKIFKGFEREIAMNEVSFAYPDNEPILIDVSVRIPKGKMIAFVGESGAGKSTLIDMIMGFNEPAEGSITFDGMAMQDFNINSYRQRIGYVPQDSVLFNTTILDNLRWSKADATESEIKEACYQANAEEFIEKFPEGYSTLVGDRGVRLSGGQIQRIALARAILRKPELLILDEATSALDTYSERLIQQSIEAIAKKTTVIVIAHRISTVVNADYIYVLKKGHIVEEGTYAILVHMDGYFNNMIKLQELKTAEKTD